MVGQKKPHSPRNVMLANGIMRFSRARMYQIKGVHKKAAFKAAKRTKPVVEKFIKKEIGGDKNNKERLVSVQKRPKAYESEKPLRPKMKRKKLQSKLPFRRLRASLKPGTVVIIVAGIHKGKRAVFLKQLKSGLLLISGPMKLNCCPLRRINQIYVIATQTRLDISNVTIPDRVDDNYFKRQKTRRRTKGNETDIFASKQEKYQVSDERKEDQIKVDKQLMDVIKKNKDKKYLFGYLGSRFGLKRGQYPHNMVF